MKIFLKVISGSIGAILFLSLTISPGRADPPLKFCIYPYKSPKTITSVFKPLATLLSEKTGHYVKLVTAPNRATFQKRALAGEYDLALACVACYFELYEKKGYSVIARGEPSFTGGLFVRADSPIVTAEQLLQGKRIGGVQPDSYAGFLFWYAYLMENKLQTQSASSYVFLESPDSVVYALLNKKIDAGIFRTDLVNSPKMKPHKAKLRMILQSSNLPHFPFIVSPNLDKKHALEITESLTSLTANSAVGRELFASMQIKSIEAVSDKDYDTFKESYNKAREAWKKDSE